MPSAATHPAKANARAWRRTRARFAWHLANVGPLPCRRCHQPIHAGDNWDLGHDHDHATGGTATPNDLWPEHATAVPGCEGNRNAGARLGNHLRHHPTDTTPSRDW